MNKNIRKEVDSVISVKLEAKLIPLCLLIGLIAAVSAEVFHWLIFELKHLLIFQVATESPKYAGELIRTNPFVILVTTVGGFIVGVFINLTTHDIKGGGENAVINAYHKKIASIRARVSIYKAIASSLTVGFGGAAGKEGPMTQIMAGLASSLSKYLSLGLVERRILFLCGVSAGVSAMFKSPVGAAFLAVEMLYSSLEMEVRALIYCIISSCFAYSAVGFFSGWHPTIDVPHDLLFRSGHDILFYSIIGISCGILSVIVPALYLLFRDYFNDLTLPLAAKTTIGGFGLGVIGVFLPEVLCGGYPLIEQALEGSAEIKFLLILMVGKFLAMTFTSGSGMSGGIFLPILCIGGLFSSAMGQILQYFFQSPPPIAAMTVVGMAAFYASIGRAPIATIFICSELTGGYELIVPTMLAVSLAFLVSPLFGNYLPIRSLTIYPAQVPTQIDSPINKQQQVQRALNIIDRGQISGSLSLPDLEKLMNLGKPIPIGSGNELVFSSRIPVKSKYKDQAIVDTGLGKNILISAIFRAPSNYSDSDQIQKKHKMIHPRGDTVLKENDKLIIISSLEKAKEVDSADLEINI